MSRVIVHGGCLFQVLPCKYCGEIEVCWLLCNGGGLCERCCQSRNPMQSYFRFPLYTNATAEFAELGLLPILFDDVADARCMIEKDLQWMETLSL